MHDGTFRRTYFNLRRDGDSIGGTIRVTQSLYKIVESRAARSVFTNHRQYNFRWVGTYHSDDPLFLTGVQDLGRVGALLLEKRGIQTALLVTTANVADRLRSQWDNAGNPWCADAFGQLQQRQGAQERPEPAARRRSTGGQALFDPLARHQSSEKAAAYVTQFCNEILVNELDGQWRLVRGTV